MGRKQRFLEGHESEELLQSDKWRLANGIFGTGFLCYGNTRLQQPVKNRLLQLLYF